ncbi:patatin-like phospholipase family protein [Oricola thermophila]|uniref:Patatin-like phospholipase family protein n=1 Tax=Oricola thermophila TaxID=2742145 RepID=A0A6N1VKC0_9HYPH|nr:patatin-like phospholipase family protein [Oricola thermophila]QKV19852.1 patatin-like phospholipase family protein [Oricola thermophila]
MAARTGKAKAKTVNLALQGGGSHGAFTWGVLDALLEDGRLEISGISGTSAGAMNAVALADGWVSDGRDGAREALHDFWHAVGRTGRFSPVQRTPFDMLWGNWSLEFSPAYRFLDLLSRVFSPYDTNPLDINPLRDVVENQIDFERVRHCSDIRIFVSATNVWTGKLRVFAPEELTPDVVMASACLPTLFKAVEIDGVPYWDGGFGGNPALFPFFYENGTQDCLLVQINPIETRKTPRTALEIQERMNEITFNAGLLREFRAIEFVRRLIADGRLEGTRYREIRMHRIAADAVVSELPASSKVNAEWAFLQYLKEMGRAAAADFLEQNFDAIGERGTLDLSAEIAPHILPQPLDKPAGRRMREAMQRLRPGRGAS